MGRKGVITDRLGALGHTNRVPNLPPTAWIFMFTWFSTNISYSVTRVIQRDPRSFEMVTCSCFYYSKSVLVFSSASSPTTSTPSATPGPPTRRSRLSSRSRWTSFSGSHWM